MSGTVETIISLVCGTVIDKGQPAPTLSSDTAFLDGELPFDSLDLAVLVIDLERLTDLHPFESGFREFRTIGELANLFDAESQDKRWTDP